MICRSPTGIFSLALHRKNICSCKKNGQSNWRNAGNKRSTVDRQRIKIKSDSGGGEEKNVDDGEKRWNWRRSAHQLTTGFGY